VRALITLTPNEGKKLISKAVIGMESIKDALKNGLLVIHPSSTTSFLFEEITGRKPEGVWLRGAITRKGLCLSYERMQVEKMLKSQQIDREKALCPWVFQKGEIQEVGLVEILEEMGPRDVYVKAGNAVDPEGRVGILFARPGAGTTGEVIKKQKKKLFEIVLPIGLEKLINIPVNLASQYCKLGQIEWARGIPTGLMPIEGTVITEIEGLKRMFDVEAKLVSAGGLEGAEGSIVLALEGVEKQIVALREMLKEVEGAEIPRVYSTNCADCQFTSCCLS